MTHEEDFEPIVQEEAKLAHPIVFYLFEIFVFLGIVIFGAALVEFGTFTYTDLLEHWYMPILGIVAATIGMTTPAGGGVVFFPCMVLLGLPPNQAVAFSLGAQSFGMGLFGTWNWTKKDHTTILLPCVVVTVLMGWVGSLLGIFFFQVSSPVITRLTFSTFGLLLAIYIFVSIWKGLNQDVKEFQLNMKSLLILIPVGIFGGLLTAYIGVGIDAILFFVLTSFLNVFSRKATVTSIVTMGFCSMLPFMVHLTYLHDVPLDLLFMVLPGILIGARIGPWLNHQLGPLKVLSGFAILLIIEFLMTFGKLLILS